MADDVLLPATGTGTANVTVAADDISGIMYPRVKVVWGANGSVNDASASAPLPVTLPKSATATGSNVSGNASNVTLLSSNSARLGASIYNDSTSAVYVKLGTTASSTDYWVKIAAGGYAEVPFGYTGRIDAIWVSATGAARIVEFT